MNEATVMTKDLVRSSTLHAAMTKMFGELINGTAPEGAWMLNGGDKGLLRSLDTLSAADASRIPDYGTSSIAAHTDHLRYGLSLHNRWSRGENAFADSDYTASWRRTTVNEDEWSALRHQLRDEASRWLDSLGRERELTEFELNTIIASIAHLAYHLGAIRQINQSIRGPKATD